MFQQFTAGRSLADKVAQQLAEMTEIVPGARPRPVGPPPRWCEGR
ncbi:MAG: hypothetical protein QOH09_2884 [Pseudonocardiales bacterium]|jgi:hypothetical protein|nr:hypothetical protein [Pseudonocardiales bacterium]